MTEFAPMLEVEALTAGYGPRAVLDNFSLSLTRGQVLGMFGHNGAGKTTLLRVISGLKQPTQGTVSLDGLPVRELGASARARLGIAFVPEGGWGIFPNLTVADNLEMAGISQRDGSMNGSSRPTAMILEQMFSEVLVRRRKQLAGSLSGGQRQMLALSVALSRQPRVLLLDEPSLGLAPRVVDQLMEAVREVNTHFGTTVLLVEQDVGAALRIAQHVCILRSGSLAASMSVSECPAPKDLWKLF